MRIVLQRVARAKCTVDHKVTGEIKNGYMLLVGFTHTDTVQTLEKACKNGKGKGTNRMRNIKRKYYDKLWSTGKEGTK